MKYQKETSREYESNQELRDEMAKNEARSKSWWRMARTRERIIKEESKDVPYDEKSYKKQ